MHLDEFSASARRARFFDLQDTALPKRMINVIFRHFDILLLRTMRWNAPCSVIFDVDSLALRYC